MSQHKIYSHHKEIIKSLKQGSLIREIGIKNYEWLINNSQSMIMLDINEDDLFVFDEDCEDKDKPFFVVQLKDSTYNSFRINCIRGIEVVFIVDIFHTNVSVIEILETLREMCNLLCDISSFLKKFLSTYNMLRIGYSGEGDATISKQISSDRYDFELFLNPEMEFELSVVSSRDDIINDWNEMINNHCHTNKIKQVNICMEGICFGNKYGYNNRFVFDFDKNGVRKFI